MLRVRHYKNSCYVYTYLGFTLLSKPKSKLLKKDYEILLSMEDLSSFSIEVYQKYI